MRTRRIPVLLASCLGLAVLAMGCLPVPSLEPQEAVNPVGTAHTLTGTITLEEIPDVPDLCDILPEECDQLQAASPLSDNVFFEVIAGPNAGTHSDGDCGPSDRDACNIPGPGGSISWTYVGAGGPGLDTIQFCPLFGSSIPESKAILSTLITTVAKEAGISEADLLELTSDGSNDEEVEVDPGCVGATKEWFSEPTRPNIGAGLSGLFQGQPTALPTAPSSQAPAATAPTIRPPSTGGAGLK